MNSLLGIQCETTNLCNSHCLFCPHSQFKEHGIMEDALYLSILEQAAKLPNLSLFIPMLTGEPFMDTDLVNRLRLARAKLPNIDLEVYTNGSLLTTTIIEEVKDISGLRFNVSLNGMSPETRRRIMGLDDYWKVVQALKAMERVGIKYRTTMVAYPDISREELASFVEAGGTVIQYQSWAGIQYAYERRRWTSCARALNYMTIRYNGDVPLCCFDPFGDVSFGNLNEQTMEEIWENSEHRRYQRLHKLGKGNELALCKNCTEG